MPGWVPTFLPSARAILGLREMRQRLIASNIANADTPGYKAQDIDFSTNLKAAEAGSSAAPAPQYVRAFPMRLDGNDVSLTAQKVEALSNADGIEQEVTFLHQSTTDLITALRPNPNGI